MRIVSGKYGGRIIEAPKNTDIRPTSDKVRGAIFNALQARGAVHEAYALDCFCGTGALGLEALSQGAADCLFIDKAPSSLDLAKKNAAALDAGDEARFILKDVQKIMARPADIKSRTLVFLDPPYGKGLAEETLDILNIRDWLAPGAICVVEEQKSAAFTPPKFFEAISEKEYGDTKIILLKYTA